MQAGELKLKERLQSLAAIAAVPSAAIGFIGDLFSPVGGWILVGAVGIVALGAAVILLATMSLKGQKFYDTLWARMTVESAESRWIWNPARPLTSHALHVVSVFGLICLLIAGKSFAATESGGILASNVPAIAVAQQQLGVTEKIYDEVRKTNVTLERIDSKADNFKRERSDDPRKELTNSGVMWEANRLDSAIKQGDIKTVDLFLQGGMPLSPFGAISAFERNKPEVVNLIIRNKSLFDVSRCKHFLSSLNPQDVLSGSEHRAGLIEALCANDAGRAVAKEYLSDVQNRFTRNQAEYKREDAQRISSKECIRVHTNDAALGTKAGEFGSSSEKYTVNDYEFMLASIQASIMVGRTDFSKPIKEYCDKQALLPVRDDDDQKRLSSWKKISGLVSSSN